MNPYLRMLGAALMMAPAVYFEPPLLLTFGWAGVVALFWLGSDFATLRASVRANSLRDFAVCMLPAVICVGYAAAPTIAAAAF